MLTFLKYQPDNYLSFFPARKTSKWAVSKGVWKNIVWFQSTDSTKTTWIQLFSSYRIAIEVCNTILVLFFHGPFSVPRACSSAVTASQGDVRNVTLQMTYTAPQGHVTWSLQCLTVTYSRTAVIDLHGLLVRTPSAIEKNQQTKRNSIKCSGQQLVC